MISTDRLNELREEVGEDAFDEVVDLFLEEVQQVMDRLKRDPDPARIEEDMHFLKGSALNLGFRAFGDLCANGEISARRSSGEVDLERLFTVYDATLDQFATFLR